MDVNTLRIKGISIIIIFILIIIGIFSILFLTELFEPHALDITIMHKGQHIGFFLL